MFVECKCGFSYVRRRTDSSPDDSFRFDYVKTYGDLWEKEFKKLWFDSTFTIRQIVERLNVPAHIPRKIALEMGLQFPRQGPDNRTSKASYEIQKKIRGRRAGKEKLFKKLKSKHRKTWLKALKNNPNALRTQLKEQNAGASAWLRKHDNDWLIANQPERSRTTELSPYKKVDWNDRDEQLVIQVHQAVKQIKASLEKPIKICGSSILREFDHKGGIMNQKYKDKIPTTHALIAEYTETRVEYNLRLTHWTIGEIIKNNISTSFSKIARKIGLTSELKKQPDIKAAIEAGLAEINRKSF